MMLKQNELVNELKTEWTRLWQDRINDKVRAEGVAVDDYSSLFIDKGTVIHATRDFKVLNFKDILEQHEIPNAERYIPPDPKVGGWNKFVKDNITQKQKQNRRNQVRAEENKKRQNAKKGGRGWLHL